jgi:hypothetical protein
LGVNLSRFRVALLVVRLELDVKRVERTFENGSDVRLPVQGVEDRHEEKDKGKHAQG